MAKGRTDWHSETPLKSGALVADDLRRRIATHELQPGDRLPSEERLMAELGLARTTLREALRILESEGLITVKRGRHGGPQVTLPPIDRLARGLALQLQLESTTISDLDEARRLIEPHLAANLAATRTDADLDALDNAIEAAAQAAKASDRGAFGMAATAVHETLVERGRNTTLAVVARMLHEVVTDYYVLAASKSTGDDMQRAVRSYRRFRKLIESADVDGAAEHWRQHMAFTVGRMAADQPLDVFPAS